MTERTKDNVGPASGGTRGEAVTVDRRLPEGRVADGINLSSTDGPVRACANDPFRLVGVRRGTVTISGFQNTNLMQPANFAVLEVR